MTPQPEIASCEPHGRVEAPKPTLLLLDDNRFLLRDFTKIYTEKGFHVIACLASNDPGKVFKVHDDGFQPAAIFHDGASFQTLLQQLKKDHVHIDAVLSDNQMIHEDPSQEGGRFYGLEAARAVFRHQPGVPFIIHSAGYSFDPEIEYEYECCAADREALKRLAGVHSGVVDTVPKEYREDDRVIHAGMHDWIAHQFTQLIASRAKETPFLS